MSSALPVLLTLHDLAIAFYVSPRTVRRWVRLGKLPRPFRVGRGLRWRQEDMVRFLASYSPDKQGPRVTGHAYLHRADGPTDICRFEGEDL
jgi:hypothetical protein